MYHLACLDHWLKNIQWYRKFANSETNFSLPAPHLTPIPASPLSRKFWASELQALGPLKQALPSALQVATSDLGQVVGQKKPVDNFHHVLEEDPPFLDSKHCWRDQTGAPELYPGLLVACQRHCQLRRSLSAPPPKTLWGLPRACWSQETKSARSSCNLPFATTQQFPENASDWIWLYVKSLWNNEPTKTR